MSVDHNHHHHDSAVLRVALFARAIRVACCDDVRQPFLVDNTGPASSSSSTTTTATRLLNSHEVDAMVHRLLRRSVPSLEAFFDLGTLAALPDSDSSHYYQLIVPVFRKRHPFTFSSELNSPTLLRAFWRAVAELVFCDVKLWATRCGIVDRDGWGHSLVFHSVDGMYEIELSDDRGGDWYFIVSLSHHFFGCKFADELRSRAGTPESSW
jgi:hypothetical protein